MILLACCKLFPEPDSLEHYCLSWKSVSQQNHHLEKIGTFQENAWAVQDNPHSRLAASAYN